MKAEDWPGGSLTVVPEVTGGGLDGGEGDWIDGLLDIFQWAHRMCGQDGLGL